MLGQNILVKTNGTASAQVARWRFELKDGVATTQDKIDFPVTRTDGKFDVVSEGTIAPGTWGEIPITVVTTGTEVHMKYDIEIVIENCPTNLKFYKDAKHKKEFPTVRSGTGEEGDPKVARISIERYVDKDAHKDNGEHEHVIYWEWPYETGKGSLVDTNDIIDTEDMKMKLATMAIAATGMQVLELPEQPADVPVTIYALFENSTGTLKLSHNPFENYSEEDTYYTGIERIVTKTANPKWWDKRSLIRNVEIIDEIKPISTYRWFSCNNLENVDLSNLNTSNLKYMGEMFSTSKITSLDLSGCDTGNVISMNRMFKDCSSLTSLDVSGWDTDNVTDMSYMFQYCSSLTSLDLSGWDTGNVTDMNSMFQNCSSLTSLDLSGWDTGNVTNMSSIFRSCSSLTSLNLSGWDTGSVTNMNTAFSHCNSLTSLDLSGWDTGNVPNMSYMFQNCNSLTSLDVSGWDTGNVTNMSYMFQNCSSLTSLDLSGWNTGNVTSMNYMFNNCGGLTSLDVSGWDTGNVTNISYMFQNCSGLTSLDLSGWNTGNVTYMYFVFSKCSKLTTIYVSDGFITDKVISGNGMFYSCSNIKGGNGTTYSPVNVTYLYARIDTPETPGYFTKK